MDRALPTSNKLISKRIHDRNRQIHLSKLNNIKSTISRQPPQSFGHMKLNKKKHQLNEDRLTEIERENKILLDKMTTIMRTTQQAPAPSLDRTMSRSLNVEYRKRELVKIAMENQSIMQRLQTQKPMLKRQAWEDSRRQHELYLRNICEYPATTGLPALKSSENPEMERPQSFQVSRDSFSSMISPKTSEKFYNPNRNKELVMSKSLVMKKNTEKLDPLNSSANQKTLLYQAKKKIGLGNYLIHVYLNNDVFNIMASNNERGDFKILSIPINEGEELVRRFGNNYRELVNKIRFKGSKIVFETNSTTFDPNDRTNSQLITNEGIVEIDDEHEGDVNTSHRKPHPPVQNKGQSVPEVHEKSPKVQSQAEKSATSRTASGPAADTQVKEQTPTSKADNVKAPTPNEDHSVEAQETGHGSKGQLENSVQSEKEQKKSESAKSSKAEVEKEQQEGEKVPVNNAEEGKEEEYEEDQPVEEEPSEKKSQEPQIEESVEYNESKEEQEKGKESSTGDQAASKESEIKEQKESEKDNKEEVVEDVVSQEYESKEESV